VSWDRTVAIGVALAMAACGNAESAFGDRAPSLNDVDGATDNTASSPTDAEEPPADTGTTAEPAWWSVDAELVVTSGALDADASTWRVTLWGEDEMVLPCSFDVPIAGAIVAEPPEVEAGTLLTWWELELDEGVLLPECPEWPAAQLAVGLGPYDGRLDPASDAHEWLDLDLYGLYLQLSPADDVLVVGVAGTEEQFDGETGAVVGPPLADGTYVATTLVLLAL